ncbi:hypothetical protein D041_0413B, partial [Vibrio parahaemolyticus EKP-008]
STQESLLSTVLGFVPKGKHESTL